MGPKVYGVTIEDFPLVNVPIKVWGEPFSADDVWSDGETAAQQFINLANHPLAEKRVCAMPDYHLGYGMPIGGVLATRNGVIPNAVGVDIGCGMLAAASDLDESELFKVELEYMREKIHKAVPVGFSIFDEEQELPKELLLEAEDLYVVSNFLSNAKKALGTLGGGNHFIEIQAEDNPDGPGRIWLMIHTGSRNIGKQVCDHYDKVAKHRMKQWHSEIPDPDLAFLPIDTDECKDYLAEMRWCMRWAEENRRAIWNSVAEATEISFVREWFDTQHNYVRYEHHYGSNYLIHRKGAVHAGEGEIVTIPGSMGTASYHGRGLGNPESFETCSHGAGRAVGRKEANRQMKGKHKEAVEMMDHVVFGVREGDYDELPFCYKDLEKVMDAQSDLVERVRKLSPLMVVKG